MTNIALFEVADGEAVAKRAFYLAWQACGTPQRMGVLQDNPEATEDDVWKNISGQEDYPAMRSQPDGTMMSDYVFGRMMKLKIAYGKAWVKVSGDQPDPEYQRWATTYKTHAHLINDAIASIENIKKEE